MMNSESFFSKRTKRDALSKDQSSTDMPPNLMILTTSVIEVPNNQTTTTNTEDKYEQATTLSTVKKKDILIINTFDYKTNTNNLTLFSLNTPSAMKELEDIYNVKKNLTLSGYNNFSSTRESSEEYERVTNTKYSEVTRKYISITNTNSKSYEDNHPDAEDYDYYYVTDSDEYTGTPKTYTEIIPPVITSPKDISYKTTPIGMQVYPLIPTTLRVHGYIDELELFLATSKYETEPITTVSSLLENTISTKESSQLTEFSSTSCGFITHPSSGIFIFVISSVIVVIIVYCKRY